MNEEIYEFEENQAELENNTTIEEETDMGLFSRKKKEEEKAPNLDEIIKNDDGTITFYDKFGNSHTVDASVNKDDYLKGIYEYLGTVEEDPTAEPEDAAN